jgi:hypothetical protein
MRYFPPQDKPGDGEAFDGRNGILTGLTRLTGLAEGEIRQEKHEKHEGRKIHVPHVPPVKMPSLKSH